jgi:hypothetical protein
MIHILGRPGSQKTGRAIGWKKSGSVIAALEAAAADG